MCLHSWCSTPTHHVVVSLLELHAVVVFLCMYIKTTCAAYNPDEVFDDLKEGCTGDISEGDTILRNWALKTPPRGCTPAARSASTTPWYVIMLCFPDCLLYCLMISDTYAFLNVSVSVTVRACTFFPCWCIISISYLLYAT